MAKKQCEALPEKLALPPLAPGYLPPRPSARLENGLIARGTFEFRAVTSPTAREKLDDKTRSLFARPVSPLPPLLPPRVADISGIPRRRVMALVFSTRPV